MQQTDNESFFSWFKQQVLKVIRDQTAELIVKQKWPLLDVVSGAYTEEIEATLLQAVQKYVYNYGFKIVPMGNFLIGIKEEDEKTLKKLYTDAAYVRMAGGMQGYQQFASGKAMMGAGEGMAKGGGGGDGGNSMLGGAALGVGFGMANMFQQGAQNQGGATQGQQTGTTPGNLAPAAPSAAADANLVVCPSCSKKVASGKFCSECGEPLSQGPKFCSNCGTKLSENAKFCPECGTKFSQ
jgi:membrane protease subunit (stomatin/prohibitin family)